MVMNEILSKTSLNHYIFVCVKVYEETLLFFRSGFNTCSSIGYNSWRVYHEQAQVGYNRHRTVPAAVELHSNPGDGNTVHYGMFYYRSGRIN